MDGETSPGAARSEVVRAEELRFSYGTRRALDGATFEVRRGEIFGFLGPNGGGKSTLFRLLATLARPEAGRLEVFGLDPAVAARSVRTRLGVVFQSPSLDPHLTVRENLWFHGRLFGLSGVEIAGRSEELLGLLGVEERGGDRVKTLSGGLRRRAEIAKALLPRPEMLLLDEPSSGLDPGARLRLAEILRELRTARSVTVLLTTHFIEEADRCDRIALLHRGRIVTEGPPADLKRQIGGEVVTLSSEDPEALQRDLAATLNLEGTVHGDTVRLERREGVELLPSIAATFPGRIRAMGVAQPTLEDVFLQRTGHALGEEGPRA